MIELEKKNNRKPKAGEQMIRLKRILAFFLDWILCMIPFALLFFAFTCIMTANPSIGNSPIIAVLSVLMALLILATFGTFLLRDAIFKRSPAKRLLKLYIYDNKTLQPATGEQCVLKNLFFFIYPIDGLVLLFSGRSLGERVAGVVVTTEQGREMLLEKQVTHTELPTIRSKKEKNKSILVVVGIVAAILLFLSLIQTILHAKKDSDEYRLAHHYLITSEAFQEISAEEKNIRFTSYKFSGDGKGNGSASLVFVVKSRHFTVILHKENGVWRVCEECTKFE
ncbi:MAG: RDD family protein [Clostridia bacterium]|nr:RDD family protein [Clostridia bacterium]